MAAPSATASIRNGLARAQAALAAGQYREAQRIAETLLPLRLPNDVRAQALLISADAAYGIRSYRQAANRYGEFLSKHGDSPEAARATLGLGWAQLRQGEQERARRSWLETAERFPADPRAPIALLLAAELASGAGDTEDAAALLGSVIAQHPSTLHAGTARLNRAILALRGNREDEGVRDLGETIRSHGSSVVDQRRRMLDALAVPGAEAALDVSAVKVSVVAATMATAAAGPASEKRDAAAAVESDNAIERFAARFVQVGDADSAPYVLHGLSLLAAADGGWSDRVVVNLVHRLVDVSPSYPAAPALLARVAAAAVTAGQWPTARRAYEQLVTRYPDSALGATARMDFAEALARSGAKTEARAQLEQAVAARRVDGPRALRLLSEVEEAPAQQWTRPLLQRIVEASDGEVASEAAYRLGRLLSAEGQHAAAVEWHMTAAYVAQESRWARLALLGAGQSLTSLQRANEALILYRKLVPQSFAVAAQDGALPPALRARAAQPEERAVMAEAAHRSADILQGAGDHDGAVDMYLTAANLTAGAPAARRALVGAMRSLVAVGDRGSAEVIYRRLQGSSDTEPALLAEARKTLGSGSATARDGAAALPKSVIE